MSDFERGKYYGKKRYSRPESSSSFGSRFFNSKNSYGGRNDDYYKDKDEKKEGKNANMKQPTILIKTRERAEDRSVSPKRISKDSESSTTPITIATPVSTENAPPPCVKQMNKSVKFIEDGIIFTEHLQDYLEENNDFVVVGVVGSQGVGKSTIMNLLANKNISEQLKKSLFSNKTQSESESGSIENIKILTDDISKMKVQDNETDASNIIFETQGEYTIQNNLNATTGIDLFITQNRIIFLDCQPFLSSAILDELINSDDNHKRSSMVNDCLPVEHNGEIYSLQFTAFLMSVCHVLILVQDWFVDSNVVRFIQSAEMLKPTISSQEEECLDYFPHLILLHNRVQLEDFSPNRFKTMQQFYKTVFSKTKMHLDSGMGLSSGRIIPYLNAECCGDAINLFLLPEYDDNDENLNTYKGHPPLEDLVKKLRANILGRTKNPLTHVTLSEKSWLVYAAKVWDHVKKSSFFVEYSKLMP